MNLLKTWLFVVFAMLPLVASADDGFAIIVHKDNPISALTMAQARAILTGDQQEWSSGKRIKLFLPGEAQDAKGPFLKKVVGMTAGEFKQHWQAMLYQNRISKFPKATKSDGLALRIVSRVKTAIAIVSPQSVNDKVKVLPLK